MRKSSVAATWIVFLIAALSTAFAAPRDEGDDEYQFIVGLLDKGMTELAVREATEFLRVRTDHPKADLARYRLATALYELDRFEPAVARFRELAALRGFDYEAEVYFRLGQCELALGRAEEAERALARVLALEADYLHAPAGYLLADAALRSGRHAEAEQRFARVLEADPKGEYAADARAGSAWCALRTGNFDDAGRRAQDYLRRHEDGARADEMRLVLGEALAGSGRTRQAVEAYTLVSGAEWSDAALRGIGFAQAELGEHGPAAEAFADLRRRFPDSRFAAEALLQEGVARLRGGDPKAALRVLAQGSDADAEVLFWRAQAHERSGDAPAALTALDAALRVGTSDSADAAGDELRARIQAARGDVLTALGRGTDAVEAYARAGSDYALHAAAVASLNEGRTAEAVELATRFLNAHPDSPYAPATRLALGEALLQQDRHDVAAEAFRAAAQGADDPEVAVRALARVAWCQYLGGQAQAAAATFERVAGTDFAEAEEALYMQGRASLEAGDSAAAARAWRDHRRRFPQGARGHEVLIELATLGSDPAAAVRDLRELLEHYPQSDSAPRARYALAARLESAGDAPAAADVRRAFLQAHPGHELVAATAYALAFEEFESGDAAAAAETLRAALDAEPGAEPDAELRAACLELAVWCERERGNAEAALRNFSALARLDAPEERLWAAGRAVVDMLRESGRADLGERLLGQMAERMRTPGVRTSVEIERAFLDLDQGDLDGAEERVRALLRAGEASPNLAEVCFFLAEARYAAKEFATAAELYRVAFETEGSALRDRALYKGGFAALESGDLEAAQARFERLVSEYPQSELFGESLFLAGECAFRRGRYEEAAVALRRVLDETPRHEAVAKAHFRLGLALGHLERWEAADRALADLAKRHPDFEHLTEAELWRGRALAGQGRTRPAEQALRRVIETDRGALAAQARNAIGELHLAAGDREAALSEFLKVAVLYDLPEEVSRALLLAGECLEGLGDRDRARQQYEELLERFPGSTLVTEARSRVSTLGTF